MRRVTRSGKEYDPNQSDPKPKPKPKPATGPRLSASERAVIERQKALASQLGVSRPPTVNNPGAASNQAQVCGANDPSTSAPAPASALTTQQRLLQQRKMMQARQNAGNTVSSLTRQATTSSILRPGGVAPLASTSSSTTVSHKRPGGKAKAGAPAELTPQQALAAARARVGIPSYSGTQKLDNKVDSKVDTEKKLGSLLSNLTAASRDEAAALKATKYFKLPEMEDYWRNIRSWNFLKDVAEANQPPNLKPENEGEQEASPTKQPLPETFESYEHYASSWAPLCLAEARAQIISDVMTEVPYMKQRQAQNLFQQVSVQPLQKDVGTGLDYVTLLLKRKVDPNNPHSGAGGGGFGGGGKKKDDDGFRQNDIIFLALSEFDIRSALFGLGGGQKKNKKQRKEEKKAELLLPMLADSDRRGMVGTCEVNGFKATVDGLSVKVSRKLWMELGGPDEMSVMKLGSNVTSLREFGALCQVKNIPLLTSILSAKDETMADRSSEEPLGIKSKAVLLEEMGGKNALGEGFAKFTVTKFNESQLEAISAAAKDYGCGGFTLVKGPPGTGKTTTLAALVNALHIKQFNKYYEEIKRIATEEDGGRMHYREASRHKPRILVCAPSNAAVDNIIIKIMEDGFIDGKGSRYNPSMVRVGSGQSSAVQPVSLGDKVDAIMNEADDVQKLQQMIQVYTVEIREVTQQINRVQKRARALHDACPWELSKDYEIRIDEATFDQNPKAFFVNHVEQKTSYDLPPPPEPGQKSFHARTMPEYRFYISQLVSLIEKFFYLNGKLERYSLLNSTTAASSDRTSKSMLRQQIETHILDSNHVVLTTLGTAGSKALESSAKFEVVIIDEAAQSVEPATLPALQLGSSHAILVGDPQQLPATIFSVSGKTTKYDRSLFQRLEEAGHPVHMLNTQYRMHPEISDFPRRIFYKGALYDGPNVLKPDYGQPLIPSIRLQLPFFRPFTILDLESSEERGGTSLSNSAEANFALHLYNSLNAITNGEVFKSKVAIISPYSQQVALLRRTFGVAFGDGFESRIEINTVDGFQGRESNIVIFSAVRAAGSKGIGFLSDVRRMNVALTRAKYFLFVIARCKSVVVNPYWRDLVTHAREMNSVLPVVKTTNSHQMFPSLQELKPAIPSPSFTTGSKRPFS